LQRKPRVSQPGDHLERDADRAADTLVSEPLPALSHDVMVPGSPRARVADTSEVLSELDGGQPLDETNRRLMESHFSESFGDVRIHTGPRAADAAEALDARAFTVDDNIVFADSEFAPETAEGRRLLAHELAHVVQQRQETAPAIQFQKHKPEGKKKSGSGPEITVDSDHGHRGKYLVYFSKYVPTREAALGLLFQDGKLPEGYELEEKGITLSGWAWRFSATQGVISPSAYQQMTAPFRKHFKAGALALTEDESKAYREREEAFMSSRPVYLGGQSVREAFQDCKGNKVGDNCWGRRAGFFYYVGWAPGHTGRVLEVRSESKDAVINKDLEWWLNEGNSLHVAYRKETEHWDWVLRQMIFGYASALSAAPGALRRPVVPTSTLAKAGQAGSTAIRAYEAFKTASGEPITETDIMLLGLAGLLHAGPDLLAKLRTQTPQLTKQPPIKQPPTQPPARPPGAPAGSGANVPEDPVVVQKPVAPPKSVPVPAKTDDFVDELAVRRAANARKAEEARIAAEAQARQLEAQEEMGNRIRLASGDKGRGTVVSTGQVSPASGTKGTPSGGSRIVESEPPTETTQKPQVTPKLPTTIRTNIGGEEEVVTSIDEHGTALVKYGVRSSTLAPGVTTGRNDRLTTDLGISKQQATQILRHIASLQPTPKTLISFAIEKGDPQAWVQSNMRATLKDSTIPWESDAFEKPPIDTIRINARIGRGNARLSPYGLVFEESYPSQFTPKRSGTTIVTEFQFVDEAGTRIHGAKVKPIAVVRVNENGDIAEIVECAPGLTPASVRERFEKIKWKVSLETPKAQ